MGDITKDPRFKEFKEIEFTDGHKTTFIRVPMDYEGRIIGEDMYDNGELSGSPGVQAEIN